MNNTCYHLYFARIITTHYQMTLHLQYKHCSSNITSTPILTAHQGGTTCHRKSCMLVRVDITIHQMIFELLCYMNMYRYISPATITLFNISPTSIVLSNNVFVDEQYYFIVQNGTALYFTGRHRQYIILVALHNNDAIHLFFHIYPNGCVWLDANVIIVWMHREGVDYTSDM